MKTLVVIAGNTDNKLTQLEWSEFCAQIGQVLAAGSVAVHFHAHSDGGKPWQNACWVVERPAGLPSVQVRERLQQLRAAYGQDSLAVLEGTTEFI